MADTSNLKFSMEPENMNFKYEALLIVDAAWPFTSQAKGE
jgi:hypothetical protein